MNGSHPSQAPGARRGDRRSLRLVDLHRRSVKMLGGIVGATSTAYCYAVADHPPLMTPTALIADGWETCAGAARKYPGEQLYRRAAGYVNPAKASSRLGIG